MGLGKFADALKATVAIKTVVECRRGEFDEVLIFSGDSDTV